jgi:hypothetical protein
MDATSAVPPTEQISVTAPRDAGAKSHFWSGSSFGFTDILAAINPLQHIPIVGPLYRAITGDTIGNAARIVGDAIYGGPIGLASGVVDVAVVEITGEDIGQHVIDLFEGDDKKPEKTATPATSAAPAISANPAATPAYLSAMPQGSALSAMPQMPASGPSLPFGNGPAASKLAAAAPITPLDVSRAVAQAQAQPSAPPPPAVSAPSTTELTSGQKQGIPIDVSPDGIARMRAVSAAHSPAPVALNLPPGSINPNAQTQQASTVTAPSAPDYVQRMKEGLAKYDALMAARAHPDDGDHVDQIH